MLSILVWWAIPAVAVVLAVAVLTASRRIRRAREDVGALHRYQRARSALERTQHPAGPPAHVQSNLSVPYPQPERTSLPTAE